MFIYLKHYLKEDFKSYFWFFRLVLVSLITVGSYILLNNFINNFVILGLMCSIIYFTGIFLFKVVDNIDLNIFNKILKR